MSTYQPPYAITPEILNRLAAISEAVGRLTVLTDQARALRLRRAPGRVYYQAIPESTRQTDSAPFIAFMLRMILDAVTTATPQVSPQVTPQVGGLLAAIRGEMGREALQSALGLSDRKSFRERYLRPALDDGLIEMTIPDKPSSRSQKYRLTDKGREWLAQHGDA